MIDCSIFITNSSFVNSFSWVMYLACYNLTIQISSSTFKLSPVFYTNVGNKPTHWQTEKIFVQNTVFDFQYIRRCVSMVEIRPLAATLNVTIIGSQFKNQISNCQSTSEQVSALNIYDRSSNSRKTTHIFLSNLLVENNYNNWATLPIVVQGYGIHTKIKVMIRDIIFRNNSAALRVRIVPHKYPRHSPSKQIAFIHNGTFVDNFYELLQPGGAAAVYFGNGRIRVSSCRFVNNIVGHNPSVGVVAISEQARVTFFNSYFENRQNKVPSRQLFTSGNQVLYFVGKNTFNLIDLSEGQSVFLRIPTGTSTGMIIKNNFEILCPEGYTLSLRRQCKDIKTGIICYYINVRCEQCPAKTYTLERGMLTFNRTNDIQCQHCPAGGDCERGVVTAKPNYWGWKSRMGIVFLQCPPGYCCDTEDCSSNDGCKGKRSGTLCGECPQGMSESLFSTQCIYNNQCTLNYPFILGTMGIFVLYLVFFLYHDEIVNLLKTNLLSKRLSFSSSNEMIKIFFYFYQVCDLLRSSVGSPKGVEFMYYITRVMNMVLVSVPSFNCPFKNFRAVPKVVVLHSMGYGLLVLLLLLYLASKLFVMLKTLKTGSDSRTELQNFTTTTSHQVGTATKYSFHRRVVFAFTHISLLMYASSAQLCFSLLHCVPVGDSHVLFLDGNIECYQPFQYFLLAYIISSILPFCLVPVLGSYLLRFGRIGVKQFCAACIFPLPFCCFWLYLLVKGCDSTNHATYNRIMEHVDRSLREEINNETECFRGGDVAFRQTGSSEVALKERESVILSVLLGSFRSHQSFMCFPSSHIPWEGFLIFRRLVVITVLTFVYDIQLRLFVVLIVCVLILTFHVSVNPFKRKRDNVLESLSLSVHVILCGLYLVKALHNDEDSSTLLLLNVIEYILILTPLSIIIIIVVFCLVIKLLTGLKFCASVLIRNIVRIVQ